MLNILEINALIPCDVLQENVNLEKMKDYIKGIGWMLEAERNGNAVYTYHIGGYERIILPIELLAGIPDITIGLAYREALSTLWRVNEIPSLLALNSIVGLKLGEEDNDVLEVKETTIA